MSAEKVLDLLVAAGHVTRAKVDEARELVARFFVSHESAPPARCQSCGELVAHHGMARLAGVCHLDQPLLAATSPMNHNPADQRAEHPEGETQRGDVHAGGGDQVKGADDEAHQGDDQKQAGQGHGATPVDAVATTGEGEEFCVWSYNDGKKLAFPWHSACGNRYRKRLWVCPGCGKATKEEDES